MTVDLAVFGFTSGEEGLTLLELVQCILKPISLELHTQPPKNQTIDLSRSHAEIGWNTPPATSLDDGVGIIRYLDLGLYGNADGCLEFFLPASWPKRIADMYRRAERKLQAGGYSGSDGAHAHILHAIESWLRAFAPAWRKEWQQDVAEHIVEIASTESPHAGGLKANSLATLWKDSYDWWVRRCANVRAESMMG